MKYKEHMKNYAEENGFTLNEDYADSVIKGLFLIESKKGEKYCPCRLTTGDKNKDKDIICPCTYHLEELKNNKKCHCNLFMAM